VHDGSFPDLYRFLSASVFNLGAANQAQPVRDVAAFMFHFPTGTKPSVGRQVTLPAGTPPTGSAEDEVLLATLVALGDVTNGGRHCELVASARSDGRTRAWHLAGGAWAADVAGAPAVTTTQLRESAASPVTFTCVPLDSGPRLGGNRDEDVVLDGDDCAPGDPLTWREVPPVTGFAVDRDAGLTWDAPSPDPGPSLRFDVLGGTLADLRASGHAAAACIASGLIDPEWPDPSGPPAPGEGAFYLIRAANPCGTASLGAGREDLEELACP